MQKKRLGFLIPPGNPNSEPEIIQMLSPEFTVHFTRMVAHGTTGSLDGQEQRNQSQIDHLASNLELLSLVNPSVIALVHTATSYTLGIQKETDLVNQMQERFGIPLITAFASVVDSLRALGAKKIAFGTPYNEDNTLKCKSLLEAHGFEIVHYARLQGVVNIYDETTQRALELAHLVDHPLADAIFLSGVGMPTLDILAQAEVALGKPVISSIAATMWKSFKVAGLDTQIHGLGQLLLRRYG
jgi:maleate cis-trans isomerase